MSPTTKRFFEQYPGMESRVKLRNYSSPDPKEIWDIGFESNEEDVKGLMKVTHPTVQEVAQEAAEEVAQSKKRTRWTTESTKPKNKMNKKKLRLEGWRDCKRDDHF